MSVKKHRVWIKQEKRIIRLLYRKGFLDNYDVLKDLYWAAYKQKGTYRSEGGYTFASYLPEMHFCSVDYWGEADEHGVIDRELEGLFWDGIPKESDWDTPMSELKSSFQYKGRAWFIKYLEALPTVRTDSKINAALRTWDY